MRLRAAYLAAGLGAVMMAGPGAAVAGCSGPFQFPVEDLDQSVFRQVLEVTRDEIERFFDFTFDAFCMDDEEYGAYYDIRANTLVVGTQFFLDVANPPGNINRAIGVIAHEAAHAFQTKHGLLNMLIETNPHRVKCIELHADFLAGGYMGWRARQYDIDVSKMTEMFFDLGDDMTQNDGHHGLGPERFLSFRQGFNTVTDDEITLSSMGIAYVSQAKCD
ncbi:hypothetical protein O4H61_05025 [Roseovarius aestuarii]|nr:hypothetical protein [Roseovarius aestuarii]